jgi:ABC-type transporter Mla subunit MlaD
VQEQLDSLKGQVRKLFAQSSETDQWVSNLKLTDDALEKGLDSLKDRVGRIGEMASSAIDIASTFSGKLSAIFGDLRTYDHKLKAAVERQQGLSDMHMELLDAFTGRTKQPRPTPLQWLVNKVLGEWPVRG